MFIYPWKKSVKNFTHRLCRKYGFNYFNILLLSSEKRSFYKSLLIWDYHVYMYVEKICQKLCPIQIGAIEELYIWQYYINYVGDIIHSHILGVDQISTTDYVENRDFWPYAHPLVPYPILSIETVFNMSVLKFNF